MPSTTYMGVDDRRDHYFRLPGTANDSDHYGAIISDARAFNDAVDDYRQSAITSSSMPAVALSLAEKATIYRDLGDRVSARRVTAELQSQHPGTEQVEALARSLQE